MIKKYDSIHYGLMDVIRNLINNGVKRKAGKWQATDLFKDEEMLVMENSFFSLNIPMCYNCLDEISADQPWVEEHFWERISGLPTNPGESYKRWPYNTFKENDPYKDGKKFSHTYQERFWPKKAGQPPHTGFPLTGIRYELGDLSDLINQLKEQPLTRQAYLPIFFPEDTGAVHKQRVPCTLGYYFWIDNGLLHCNYLIRSCDALRHFRNDVYLTARLMQHVASEIGINTGKLNFMAFNFHTFVNDLYALNKKEHKIRYKDGNN